MVTLVELLMSEYRCTHHEAMWEFPLAKLIALLPARARRLGLESKTGDHVDKAMNRARAKVRRLLRDKFTVVPNFPARPQSPT